MTDPIEPHTVTCPARYHRNDDCTCGYTATGSTDPIGTAQERELIERVRELSARGLPHDVRRSTKLRTRFVPPYPYKGDRPIEVGANRATREWSRKGVSTLTGECHG